MLNLTCECVMKQWHIISPTSCKDMNWTEEEDELIRSMTER